MSYAPCPVCANSGLADIHSNQLGQPKTPRCRVCKGFGKVRLDAICECGQSAVFTHRDTGISYCGKEACLNAAKFRYEHAAKSAESNDDTEDYRSWWESVGAGFCG